MRLSWKGSKADLLRNLRLLPSVLAGKSPDPHGLARIFLAHLGNAVLKCLQEDFETKSAGGTGRDGVKWPPLSIVTLQERRRKGISHKEILVETEALRTALTPGATNDPDAVRIFGQLFAFSLAQLRVGIDLTEIHYAEFHQTGTPFMPARRIVPDDMPAGWEPTIADAARAGIEKVMEVVCDRGGVA